MIGGGCYGSFYTRQLQRAKSRNAIRYQRLLVVDRDAECAVARIDGDHEIVGSEWSAFLDEYLPTAGKGRNLIVPSPLMPHLFFEWLQRRAREAYPGRDVLTNPLTAPLETPYEIEAPDRTRYVSYADWLCPTHCIEPSICPVTRAPRTWDMALAVGGLAGPLGTGAAIGPIIFECRHVAFGVGAVPTDQVLAGEAAILNAGGAGPVDVIVATVSGCHGAVNLLHLGAWP